MSFAFNAAPFTQNTSNEKNYIQRKQEAKNKTIKRRETNNNVEAMIQLLHNNENNENNDDMADFNPIPPPHSESVSKTIEKQTNPQRLEAQTYNDALPNKNSNLQNNATTFNNSANSIYESFEQKGINSAAADYYQQYIPTFYNKMSDSNGGNKELLDKLNYMIHLLEEQQEEKTGHVTEEIILYSFLGVFLIFIVDSFARAGKYMR
jgi:hypothetical protein